MKKGEESRDRRRFSEWIFRSNFEHWIAREISARFAKNLEG